MSRICELTGKGRQVGHNVSHANNKTKRVFLPNLQPVTLMSEKLDRSFKFRVSTHGLRSVEHNGGLDNWLIKTSDEKLSSGALKVKRELKKALAAARACLHANRKGVRSDPRALSLCRPSTELLGSKSGKFPGSARPERVLDKVAQGIQRRRYNKVRWNAELLSSLMSQTVTEPSARGMVAIPSKLSTGSGAAIEPISCPRHTSPARISRGSATTITISNE